MQILHLIYKYERKISMAIKKGRASFAFSPPPSVITFAAVGGKMEHEGPMGSYFDKTNDDPYFTTYTYEQGESKLQKEAIRLALKKINLQSENVSFMFGGDLLNQCVGTTFGIRDYEIPFLGIYGACSTMSEGLLLSALSVDSKAGELVLAVTSSHYCTAERQYRFPLDYGGQRTPTAQWTATASGALVVSPSDSSPFVRGASVGRIIDLDIHDANNMGAAMAPAAADTIKRFFKDFKLAPKDFDYIVTGDLGKIGSELLIELLSEDGIDITKNHLDCGMMIYDFEKQDVHAGGSGCGCAASMLCGYFLPRIKSGEIKNIFFAATGALMSPTVVQQGESIPSISHGVWISHERGN